ncbi:MAG: lytic transglycosylase domain-containing protein [Gammaproteobacteria bacterium]|nr:lytic transglycosylase domain-containing protein [Gammaproteobacteria bacterium]
MSHVEVASRRYNLDPALVEAVIYVESGFDPHAVSHRGAAGLMQLMKGTAESYRVSERHDPRQNIHAGTKHLAALLDRFGTVRLALAAYNAGAGAVKRYDGVPPYPETQRYIKKVFERGMPISSGTNPIYIRKSSPMIGRTSFTPGACIRADHVRNSTHSSRVSLIERVFFDARRQSSRTPLGVAIVRSSRFSC